MIAAALIHGLARKVYVEIEHYAQGTTWTVRGMVALTADGATVEIDDAVGSVYGRVCWYESWRFAEVLGRVEWERLEAAMVRAAEEKVQ